MRFLLDTNVLIKLEPASAGEIEPDALLAARLNQLITEGGHRAFVHPAITYDINRDTDTDRQTLNRFLFSKWPELQHPPQAGNTDYALGIPAYGSNDWVDHQLALAAERNAVDHVITEDSGLIRRFHRAGLSGRALRLAEAVDLLEALGDHDVPPPPAVTPTKVYSLDRADPIWDSFRSDYPEFDVWFERAASEHRLAWYITTGDCYDAVCIVKSERDDPHGIAGKVLKLSSFKVREQARGSKYGELLLKTVLRHAHENAYERVYVEVFSKYDALISMLEQFGFSIWEGAATPKGERVLVKSLQPDPSVAETLSTLEYHIRYGPPAVHPNARLFVVPIQPRFHAMLFPELEPELEPAIVGQEPIPGLEMAPERPRPYGSAIRKAYLCHAAIRSLSSGDCLLFYRSGDLRAITAVGVVESVMVSKDPTAIARFVGTRTVYTLAEIEEMAAQAEVLALLFRHDRSVQPPLRLEELRTNGALGSHPQSISSIREEGTPWLRSVITARR